MDDHSTAIAIPTASSPGMARRMIKLGPAIVVMLILAAVLFKQGDSMRRAIARVAIGHLALGLGLCLVYRVANAFGWSLVLRALGHPLRGTTAVRIWLTSEAFRWLPGGVWGFGSRAVLASRQGVPPAIATVSVLLELLLTVAAWGGIAALGWGGLRNPLPQASALAPASIRGAGIAASVVLATLLGWVWASRSPRVLARLGTLRNQLRLLHRVRVNSFSVGIAWAYYLMMGLFNGIVFEIVLLSAPQGFHCPVAAAVTANALAWLVGFFAFMAPGGLVVREGCLCALLATWVPLEEVMVVALAWRSLQIVAEGLCVASIGACGVWEASWGRAGSADRPG